jgi:hypothetical protein
VISLIQEHGAITASLLTKLWPSLPKEEACRILARHVALGDISFIPALPKQAIFFALPEDSNKFALSLRRQKRFNGEGSSLYTVDEVIKALGTDRESGLTVTEVMTETAKGRETVIRALLSLIKNGQVLKLAPEKNPPGVRGRPASHFKLTKLGLQGLPDDTTVDDAVNEGSVVIVNFSGVDPETGEPIRDKGRPKRGSGG